MRRRRIFLPVVLFTIVGVGCDETVRDPTAPLVDQSWSQTVGEIEGIPIGEVQVERAVEEDDQTRDEALSELRTRKRILAKALQDPPKHAELHFRQAMVQAMLIQEAEDSEAGGSIDKGKVDQVREELTEKLRKPAGFVATIVHVQPKPDLEVPAAELLETAEELVDSIGDDPTDDEVAALADLELEERVVTVNYAVPFPAADETKSRRGWASVSPIGAGEIQTLEPGDRVTTAYTINPSVAEFMVKIAEIPSEPPEEDVIEKMIEDQLDKSRRENYSKRLVDRLVDEGSWTLYPETMEGDLEGNQ